MSAEFLPHSRVTRSRRDFVRERFGLTLPA